MDTVYVFLANGFEEMEALAVVDILRRAKIPTVTISITDNTEVVSSHGIKVCADKLFRSVDFSNAGMIVLPGGMPGTLNLFDHKGLQTLISDQYHSGKQIAAICAAPLILGRLGLLKGKRVTCYPGYENELIGATYTGALLEEDGTLLTAKGAGVAYKFGYRIVARILNEEVSEGIAQKMIYTER